MIVRTDYEPRDPRVRILATSVVSWGSLQVGRGRRSDGAVVLFVAEAAQIQRVRDALAVGRPSSPVRVPSWACLELRT